MIERISSPIPGLFFIERLKEDAWVGLISMMTRMNVVSLF